MGSTGTSKTPVSIITGFLGSGKTTLINYILTENHGKQIAIVENEFGEVGIDDALVMQAQEEIFEMNNGCVCCSVRGDLIRILKKLDKRRNKFDCVIIETTGMADPAPVLQTFFVDDELQAAYQLDAVITVVDAKHILMHLDEDRPEGVENESEEQIAFADRILLNKTDLVSEQEKEAIKQRIKAINKPVQIVECTYGRVPMDQLLGIQAFNLDQILAKEPDFLDDKEHEHDSTISSVGITREGTCDMDRLQGWLQGLLRDKGNDLFRSKGVLAVDGSDDRYVFQGVHMLLQMTCSSQGDCPPWGPDEKRNNRVVFIGRNLDREGLTKSFEWCLVPAAAAGAGAEEAVAAVAEGVKVQA